MFDESLYEIIEDEDGDEYFMMPVEQVKNLFRLVYAHGRQSGLDTAIELERMRDD